MVKKIDHNCNPSVGKKRKDKIRVTRRKLGTAQLDYLSFIYLFMNVMLRKLVAWKKMQRQTRYLSIYYPSFRIEVTIVHSRQAVPPNHRSHLFDSCFIELCLSNIRI